VRPPPRSPALSRALGLSHTSSLPPNSRSEQLERLAALGHHYAALEAFVDAEADAAGAPGGSAARAALAAGLAELLDVYRGAVLALERRLAAPPAPPLLALRRTLADFEALLPDAASAAGEVARRRLAGADVARLLEARMRSGVPAVRACAARLAWHVRQVTHRQLEAWTLHGLLLDPTREFFVQRIEGGDADGCEGDDADGDAKTPLAPDPALPDWRPGEWHDGFEVAAAALPPGVSPAAAEAALFVGKAVRVLRVPAGGADTGAGGEAGAARAAIAELAPALRALARAEAPRPAALEAALGAARARAAALLWDLVRRRADLAGQLAAMQAYALLGRGDLAGELVAGAAALFAAPPRAATAAADAAAAYRAAAARCGADADPAAAAFSLGWADARAGAPLPAWHPARARAGGAPPLAPPAYDAWDGLALRADVGWPLRLLFPPALLRTYATLWQSLFRARRAQAELEGAWAALRRPGGNAGAAAPAAAGARARLARLRQRAAHFASNLHLYLQLDVVAAGAAALRRRVAAADDFGEADAAHRAFLSAAASHALLDAPEATAALTALLALCRRACALAAALAAGAAPAAELAAAAGALDGEWRAAHAALFKLLRSERLQAGDRAPALRRLLLRLDYNEFCGAEAARGGAAAPPAPRRESEG
jgi:gamma-tubulin complex component 4